MVMIFNVGFSVSEIYTYSLPNIVLLFLILSNLTGTVSSYFSLLQFTYLGR